MFLIVGVDVDQRCHGVLVAADHGAGDGGQGEEPHGVHWLDVERTGPDRLLVEQDPFWGASEGDRFRF